MIQIHPAIEAAVASPVLVRKEEISLYLYFSCGHQQTMRVFACTIHIEEGRIISFPSAIISPEKCPLCKVQKGLEAANLLG